VDGIDRAFPAGRGAVRADQRAFAEARVKDENPIPAQTQRLASLGFMLASVCHEVSNPLAAVSSMLQILQSKRGVTPETLEKGLASIAANIARVSAITKKLGDYSRVDGEAPAPLAVDEAVEAAATLLHQSPTGQDVELDYRSAPGVTVLARPSELERVLFNIFLNAAQAMQGAGRIEVRAKPKGREVALSIRDTGPGIAAEHLPRVFDPFFTTKPPGEGIGLGLAISNELVHEMRGSIRASNDPRGGARFEIVLPT
jgi:C4-dicarboxylate-specific signal transduction histidine kinase